MIRSSLVLAFAFAAAGACREPPLQAPVPDLLSPTTANASRSSAHFVRGEVFVWDVYNRGLRVGRLELSVSVTFPLSLRARLHPGRLARKLGHFAAEVTTQLGRDRLPVRALEITRIGTSRRTELRFSGTRVNWRGRGTSGSATASTPIHSVLSCLGALRSERIPVRLFVATGSDLLVLTTAPPTTADSGGETARRVDAEARDARGSVVAVVSVWLSENERRLPLRMEIDTAGTRLVAKLRTQGSLSYRHSGR